MEKLDRSWGEIILSVSTDETVRAADNKEYPLCCCLTSEHGLQPFGWIPEHKTYRALYAYWLEEYERNRVNIFDLWSPKAIAAYLRIHSLMESKFQEAEKYKNDNIKETV